METRGAGEIVGGGGGREGGEEGSEIIEHQA